MSESSPDRETEPTPVAAPVRDLTADGDALILNGAKRWRAGVSAFADWSKGCRWTRWSPAPVSSIPPSKPYGMLLDPLLILLLAVYFFYLAIAINGKTSYLILSSIFFSIIASYFS